MLDDATEYKELLSDFLATMNTPSDSMELQTSLGEFFDTLPHFNNSVSSCQEKFAPRRWLNKRKLLCHPHFSGHLTGTFKSMEQWCSACGHNCKSPNSIVFKEFPKEEQWCNLTKESTTSCIMNIREITYNVTRQLRQFFPELVPENPIGRCREEQVPNYGRGVFERLGIDYKEFMRKVMKPYKDRYEEIWDINKELPIPYRW